MRTHLLISALALTLAGCMGPEAMPQLEAEAKALKTQIAQAREEQKAHGKGSVVHDLITLRIAVQEQTLAMLEQRRAAGSWRTKLVYVVNAKSWEAPADVEKRVAAVERRLRATRKGRDSDLARIKEADEAVKSLYAMSAATKAILISQLEYQLAGYRHGFPPYYVPFYPPAAGKAPPQIIDVPAGRPAIVQ